MKGKGKGKETSESKDCPLQFLDLTPMDPLKNCKVYSSILKQGEEEVVHFEDIENLQYEFEALLVSVMKRRDDIEEETEVLTAWQEKREPVFQPKPFSGKSEAETSGKRSRVSEGKPSKKHRDNSGKAQPSPSVGRPKTKYFQAAKRQEYDAVDSPTEGPKPLKTDAPNRFWASLEPYFADITADHIKFLEDWVQVHDDDEEYFKIPPLGKHYSFEWANKNIQEEQKEGMKANEKKKDLSNSCLLNSVDREKLLQKAEKVDAEDNLPLGPLAQRLVSCLIEEKIMPSLEDTIDTTKEIAECPKSPHTKTSFLTSLNINNTMELENRIRKELEEAGILEPEEGDAENPDDAVLAELKEVQASLKIVTEHNLVQKKRLLELAKEEMARQEVVKKLQYLDSEIMDVYRRKQKRKSPSKKEREQTFAKLKERESLVQQLESMGNISL